MGFQFNYEKNHFWEYIQDKYVKSLKRTKLDSPIVYKDWAIFEQLTYKII